MAKKEAPRRNYKSGSIYVDNSKNLLYASIVSPSGKRIKESFALNDRSSADRWLTEKRMEFYDSTFIDPSLITLGEWVLYWLENYVSISVKPITQRGYKESILYLTPLFDYRLQDITRDLLQKHLKEMENGGYAPSTLEKVKKRLKHLFNYAIENKKVSENPANGLKTPIVQQRKDIPITAEETQKLLQAAKNHRWSTALLVGLTGGLRPSELFEVTFSDFDFDKNTLYLKGSKTIQSNRTIILPEATMKNVRRLYEKRKTMDLETDILLSGLTGQPVNQRYFYRWFQNIFEKAGVEYRSPGMMRHTHATALLQNNESILEVSRRLGHSKPSTTLDRYGHAILGKDQLIADKTESLMGLGSSSGSKESKKQPKKTEKSLKITKK